MEVGKEKDFKTNYYDLENQRNKVLTNAIVRPITLAAFGTGLAGLGVAGLAAVGARSTLGNILTINNKTNLKVEEEKRKQLNIFGDKIYDEFTSGYEGNVDKLDLNNASIGELVKFAEQNNLKLSVSVKDSITGILAPYIARINSDELSGVQAKAIKTLNAKVLNLSTFSGSSNENGELNNAILAKAGQLAQEGQSIMTEVEDPNYRKDLKNRILFSDKKLFGFVPLLSRSTAIELGLGIGAGFAGYGIGTGLRSLFTGIFNDPAVSIPVDVDGNGTVDGKLVSARVLKPCKMATLNTVSWSMSQTLVAT